MNKNVFYIEPIGSDSNKIIADFLEQQTCVSKSDTKCELHTGKPVKCWSVGIELLPTLLAARVTGQLVFIVYSECKPGFLRVTKDSTILQRVNFPHAKQLARLIRDTVSKSARRDKMSQSNIETQRVKAYTKYAYLHKTKGTL